MAIDFTLLFCFPYFPKERLFHSSSSPKALLLSFFPYIFSVCVLLGANGTKSLRQRETVEDGDNW
jgi:hypothetical protein